MRPGGLRIVLALLVTACLLSGCSPPESPADQIRQRIKAMEAAGEAGERGKFMDFVVDGFEAQGGGMTRDDFRRFMFFQMSQQRRIMAQLFPIDVTFTGDNLARAEFKALLTGGGGLIPEEGQLFQIDTQWVLEAGEWYLWRADWQALGP